uniref:Photosystem I assembly protein Ycf4 n=1 Tax=Gracilaria edulis TaxID=172966 RepID=A0A6C0A8N4_9FLOR|nr:photosystem I assembly protein Ycf4 [Gracilaria edulis]QHS70532.1 photosystem I assembly protein Ycf4 [Gracilaria edulis]UAD85572.1 photosystem I assembly protein ycf4 [Gracilaria edulis]
MPQTKTDKILGSRRFSNYFWATIIFLGGLSFFLVGLSSYFKIELLPFTNSTHLLFLPQGIIMTFYGTTAILISVFLWLTIIWNVGSGYNEFNRDIGLITIFRLGFPGKNRVLKLNYKINEIYSIKVNIQDGLTPRREIYLKTKDQREIPLTRVGQPMLLSELEDQAATLAKFLGVIVEGIS